MDQPVFAMLASRDLDFSMQISKILLQIPHPFRCELKRIPNDLASSGRNVLLAPSVPKTDGTIPFNIPNISQWPTTENKPTLATAASMVPPHYTGIEISL